MFIFVDCDRDTWPEVLDGSLLLHVFHHLIGCHFCALISSTKRFCPKEDGVCPLITDPTSSLALTRLYKKSPSLSIIHGSPVTHEPAQDELLVIHKLNSFLLLIECDFLDAFLLLLVDPKSLILVLQYTWRWLIHHVPIVTDPP